MIYILYCHKLGYMLSLPIAKATYWSLIGRVLGSAVESLMVCISSSVSGERAGCGGGFGDSTRIGRDSSARVLREGAVGQGGSVFVRGAVGTGREGGGRPAGAGAGWRRGADSSSVPSSTLPSREPSPLQEKNGPAEAAEAGAQEQEYEERIGKCRGYGQEQPKSPVNAESGVQKVWPSQHNPPRRYEAEEEELETKKGQRERRGQRNDDARDIRTPEEG